MALTLKEFLEFDQSVKDLKSSLIKMGYTDIKDISNRKFKILVPSNERMKIAEKLVNQFNGNLTSTGADAGKPVVELKNGIKIYVKPKPGSGVGGTAKEDAQLISLQNQIFAELKDNDLMELPVKIGKTIYNIASAASTPGTPKSDFHLLNSKKQEIVWISHKDGSTAKDFQQWSGMSIRSELDISKHIETKDFVNTVKKMFANTIPTKSTVSRLIKDKKLANMAIYGNKYGQGFGRDNVTILLQGPVKLIRVGTYYELRSNHTSINGAPMTGGYKAAFMAMYKGDRSDYGVKGARFVIQPIDSRKSQSI